MNSEREEGKGVEIKRRHPALVVLKALLEGHPIPVDGEEWYLQDGVFGPKRVMQNSETKEEREVILGVDMSLPAFVKWCEKLPEETVIQMAFSAAMSQMKKKRP